MENQIKSGRGGYRPGAGRKRLPPEQRKLSVAYRFPIWLVEWMRAQETPATQLIEEALVGYYGLRKDGET